MDTWIIVDKGVRLETPFTDHGKALKHWTDETLRLEIPYNNENDELQEGLVCIAMCFILHQI